MVMLRDVRASPSIRPDHSLDNIMDSNAGAMPVVKSEEMPPPPPPAPAPLAAAAPPQPAPVAASAAAGPSRRMLRPPPPPKVPLSSVGQRRLQRAAAAPQRRPTAIRLVTGRGAGGSQGPRMGQTSHIFGAYDRDLDEDPDEPLVFEEQFILRVPQEVLEGDKEHGVKGLAEMVKAKNEIEGVSIKFKGA